jgi:hypothetical protein
MNGALELPKNKPAINGKYRTATAIKNAIYNVLKNANVEGRYDDENWVGVQYLQRVLRDNGVEYDLLDASYMGHGEVNGSNLPTRKVYRFELTARDKEGKNVPLYLKVTCAFVGKTGTMADGEYELTYYFF